MLISWVYSPLWTARGKAGVPVIAQAQWARINASDVFEVQPDIEPQTATQGLVFPRLYCSVVDQARVYGCSNFLMSKGVLLHHDLYAFETDFTSEENSFKLVFGQDFCNAIWISTTKLAKEAPIAAVFTDGCSANYAHWMTEVLPRIAVFCSDARFKSIPLVVDKGLHSNIQASLRAVAGYPREIYELEPGEHMEVHRLYWMSVAGYVPYERRTSTGHRHAQGMFSPHALALTRRVCLEAANPKRAPVCAAEAKIYVRRNSAIRKLVNGKEIELLLEAQGFQFVEPEKLSFHEQIRLFAQAKCIVGPTGAAFANLLFARPDAHIVVLMGEHPDTSIHYWKNVASAVGVQVKCLLGPIWDNGRGIHSDFFIDPSALDRALRQQ